jgi:ABC-2 type transport system ATP-binding protein
MSITVKQITKKYSEQKALDEVSFTIHPGEIVGFLGPNGAGKSTMMKIITGFIPPTAGEVNVCGFEVEAQSMEVRKNIGYLPEHNPLYLDMYVKEYLEFIAGVHGLNDKRKRVKEMIELVGLGLEQNKKIGALSKGYRQRIGLAQSLIHDPQVLVLDEPTTGLDPNQIGEIRNLIRNVGKQKTVMLSTHIMQEVEAICDRVIIINKGRIVANEKVENLQQLTTPTSIFYVEFDQTVDKKELLQLKGVERVSAVNELKWKIESGQNIDIRIGLTQFASTHQLTILGLSREETSLESVFKQLTLG